MNCLESVYSGREKSIVGVLYDIILKCLDLDVLDYIKTDALSI